MSIPSSLNLSAGIRFLSRNCLNKSGAVPALNFKLTCSSLPATCNCCKLKAFALKTSSCASKSVNLGFDCFLEAVSELPRS